MTLAIAPADGSFVDWLRGRRPIGRLLLAVLLLNLVAAAALHPFVRRAAEDLSGVLVVAVWGAAVLSPLVALAKSLVFALLAWAIATLADETMEGARVVAASLAAELALGASGIFSAVVLAIAGRDAIRSPADLYVPQGVDVLIPVPAGWPAVLNQHLGLFHIFWILALFLGLRRVADLSAPVAAMITAACWALLLCAGLARLALA